MRLKNILLVVKDIEKSKKFYNQLFGMQIVRDFGENVILTEGLVLQEQKTWESLTKTETITGNGIQLYFEENNLANFMESVKAHDKKIEFIGDVRTNSWGKEVIMLKDPDGHIIEVAGKADIKMR